MTNIQIDKQKLLYFMNLRKITPKYIADQLGLVIPEVEGDMLHFINEDVDKIANFLHISADDLIINNLPLYIHQSHIDMYASKRPIHRDGIHFYNYYSLPSPKGYVSPVILDILCPENVVPKLNNGHFEEAITVNLGPGDIYGRWDDDIKDPTSFSVMHANNDDDSWIVGDSYFEPSYCKHSYSLVSNEKPARILSYTAFNDLAEFKKQAMMSCDVVKTNLYDNYYKKGFQGVVKKYLSAQMMSVDEFCLNLEISLEDFGSLSYQNTPDILIEKIAHFLKIDPRLLMAGSNGGDGLGKEYCSIEQSRKNIRKFGEYFVAPIACSSRAPDLKGSFLRLDNVKNGTDLILGHNAHYLIMSGSIDFVSDAVLDSGGSIKMTKDDSLWVSAGQAHRFNGNGSILMLTNGQGGSYLNHYALQNAWDSNALLNRIKSIEMDWGYERIKK